MNQTRSYRRRGTPDLPMAVYVNNASIAGHFPTPEYHPETEIVLVLVGSVVLQLGGTSQTFREGDIFVIPGNMVHNYLHFSPDALYCSLIFSADAVAMQPTHFFQQSFVQPLQEGLLQFPQLIQPGHPAYETVRLQLELLRKSRIFEKDYQIQRFSCLMNICTALMPYCHLLSSDRPLAAPGNETVRLCMRYIHNQLSSKLTLEVLAQHCHLHPNYLCALFKNYTGQTIFEYITRYRVETAAHLLKNEDLPMSKVAELVGFHSESLFYRKFKEITGLTPKAYAKQQKNK